MKKTVEAVIKQNVNLITYTTPQDIKVNGEEIIVIRIFSKDTENFDEVKKELGL